MKSPVPFRLLRTLFPRAFRDAFADEMDEVFAAQLRDARARGRREAGRLWLRTAAGMATAAWRERRDGTPARQGRAAVFAWSDLRYTVRRLAAAPGFTFATIATLALCMGANLTIFAAVDSILLRPLPFPDAGRLVAIYNTYPRANVMDDGATVANYFERRGIAALAAVSLYKNDAVIVGETGSTEREFVMRVSADFFGTLGVAPMLGRGFREEELSPGVADVVLVTEPYWRQQLAADRSVVGRTIRINGGRYTIAGVLPAGFRFLSSRARLFLPYVSTPDDRLPARRHSGSSSQMVARLGPGVTIDEAQSQIDAHNAVMEQQNPQRRMIADAGFRSLVVPLHARHVATVRPVLILLQAGAVVLLAIGMVNVGNLFLLRAGGRTRELAVRRAIGARASHIAASVVAETLLVAAAGAVAGLALAQGGIALLSGLGAARLPLGSQIALGPASILVAAAAALAAGALLGGAIAAHHLRNQAGDALRTESRGGTAGRQAQRTRHAILVAQIALSFVLLAGAALLGAGLRDLMRVSPGFRSEQLLTGQVSLPWVRYRTGASLQAFIDRLNAELQATPGVVASGIATNIPLSGNAMKSVATVAGRTPRPGESPRGVYAYAVAGDYMKTMDIPLQEGRYLTVADAGPSARACVVDEQFACRYWPSGGAIGQRLFLGSSQEAAEEAYTVVGVVGAVKQASLSEGDAAGAVYYPYSDRFDRAIYVVTRTTLPPDALQAVLRGIVRRIDSELPVNNLRSMEARVADSMVAHRSPAIFAAVFASVALVLTALGTYGVLGYAVSQRRREIGIRIALGARPRQVRGQFLRVGLQLLGVGMALGVAGSWAAGKALRASLPAIPQAPVTALVVAAAVMAAVCVAACLLPARRAARIAPIEALARD